MKDIVLYYINSGYTFKKWFHYDSEYCIILLDSMCQYYIANKFFDITIFL